MRTGTVESLALRDVVTKTRDPVHQSLGFQQPQRLGCGLRALKEAPVPGKITRIAVTYAGDTADGPRHTFHGLPHMRRHIRPERLSELIDDLTVICENLIVSRGR
jgi:hypothetical protein